MLFLFCLGPDSSTNLPGCSSKLAVSPHVLPDWFITVSQLETASLALAQICCFPEDQKETAGLVLKFQRLGSFKAGLPRCDPKPPDSRQKCHSF